MPILPCVPLNEWVEDVIGEILTDAKNIVPTASTMLSVAYILLLPQLYLSQN